MPQRIQRKRTRGWKMPPNTVYVGRPTKWGNPYKVGNPYVLGFIHDAAMAVSLYRIHANITFRPRQLAELRGKDLACWCKEGDPCHADVLLEIANS